ncbi:MAG: hypothetical protein FJY91_01265 [Candidatus Harrisonbacteria bacterium]|nr:hypothetical protein [Candidatus Harrisonbacteria bacterium]
MLNTQSPLPKQAGKSSPPNPNYLLSFLVFISNLVEQKNLSLFILKLDYLRSRFKSPISIGLVHSKKETITAKEIIFCEKATRFFPHLFLIPDHPQKEIVYKHALEKTKSDWLFSLCPQSFAAEEKEILLILNQLNEKIDLLLFEREKKSSFFRSLPISFLFWIRGLFIKDLRNPNFVIHRALLHYILNIEEKSPDFFMENIILKSDEHGARIKVFPLKNLSFLSPTEKHPPSFLDAFRFVCKNLKAKK